jgi:hypothetical protein
MRNWAALLLMVTAGCTGCSGGETPPSPEEDAVRDGGIWSPDRGAGIEVLAAGRSLPPAHLASAAELRPDAGPGPFSDMRIHVDLSGTVRTVPCAVPSGSYCDGFAVVDLSGATIAVDTYAYLGAKPACRSRWAEGTRVASLSGVWQQRAAGASTLSVLALSSCDDLDGPAPAGGSAAPSSDEVHQLVGGWVPGRLVSVHGVVVARWKSSSGAFGLAMQDPDGAASSGVRLVRSRTSTIPARAPEVGDWIRVTARTARDGEHLLEL